VPKRKASKYLYVKAWNTITFRGAFHSKIEQARAAKEKAPENAMYKDEKGVWITYDDITSESIRDKLDIQIQILTRGMPDIDLKRLGFD